VNIADQFEEIRVFFADDGFVPVLEEMVPPQAGLMVMAYPVINLRMTLLSGVGPVHRRRWKCPPASRCAALRAGPPETLTTLLAAKIVFEPILKVSSPVSRLQILFSIYCISFTQAGFIIYERKRLSS
jgi:hypothetical protein